MPRNYKRKLGSRRYSDYTDEQLKECLASVKAGLSLRKAEIKYQICRKTIQNKLKMKHPLPCGRPRIFSVDEETLFADSIILMSEFGFPVDATDTRHIIKSYLNRTGRTVDCFKDNMPGVEWTQGFLKRNPLLTARLAENIKTVRAAIDKETLTAYIEQLKTTIEGIPPENIFNYDETNLTDDPGSKKVIVKRGCKYPENICNKSKAAISIMMCGSAAGEVVPPFVVYKSKYLWDTWTMGGPTGSRYSNSVSGWFNTETFSQWFKTVMLPILKKKEGETALIGDNLSSHINEEVLELCKQHSVKFICLPPNSTHITQPLDVCYFRPLKNSWRKILRRYKENDRTKSCIIQKQHFPGLLKELLSEMGEKSAEILKGAFLKCGIVPCDVAPLLKRLPNSSPDCITPEQDTEARKAFIDFFSDKRASLAPPSSKRRKLSYEPGTSLSTPGRKSPDVPLLDEQQPSSPLVLLNSRESSPASDLSNLPDSSGGEWQESNSDEDTLFVKETTSFNGLRPEDKAVGAFVAFMYEGLVYPGRIVQVEEDSVKISAMEKTQKAWRWPEREDCLSYPWKSVLGVISQPIPVNKRGYYLVKELDN